MAETSAYRFLTADPMGREGRYENQPEPELKGPSVTIRAPDEQIADMKRRAQEAWPPALAALMKVALPSAISRLGSISWCC